MSRLESGALGAAAALAVYAIASVLMFGLPALADPVHRCVCSGTDPALYIWGLAWWPHALAHGLDPLHANVIFAPGGADLASATTVPGPSLVASPITAASGPLVSYDLLAVASPALAALTAFLLCRQLTHRFAPSLAGGWVFGFSAYELGQLTTHLNLALVFVLPLLVLLTLRFVAGALTGPRFAALTALALLGQLSISSEVLFTGTLVGAVTVAAAWVTAVEHRGAIGRAAGWLLVAYGTMSVLASVYLVSALRDGGPAAVGDARQRGADLLSFVLPTRLAALGGGATPRVAIGSLAAGYVETGVYIGAPLLAVLVIYWTASWRTPAARVLLTVFGVASLLALGSSLWVDGHKLVPLPWQLLSGLPLFDAILPIRLGVYAALAAAVGVALWLSTSAAWQRWGLAAVAIVALLPSLGHGYWSSTPRVPAFFSGNGWQAALGRRDIALVLPDDDVGAAMLWQATTKIGFTMASGYLGENGHDPQARDPLRATLLRNGPSTPALAGQLAAFIARHRVSVVVVDPQDAGPWPLALAGEGLRPRSTGGVLLYRIVPRSLQAVASIEPSRPHPS